MALQAQWQEKLDRDFPKGAAWIWNRPGDPIAYNLPWIEVVGMRGLDPIVACAAHGSLKVLGPWQVTSYTISVENPVQARVTFDNIDDAASWLQPTPTEAGLMAPDRVQQMRDLPWASMVA